MSHMSMIYVYLPVSEMQLQEHAFANSLATKEQFLNPSEERKPDAGLEPATTRLRVLRSTN